MGYIYKIWNEDNDKLYIGQTSIGIKARWSQHLKNYLTNDDPYNELWNNHLYGLLFEYLRGLPNAEEDLETLRHAYNLDDQYNIENGKVIKEPSQNA